MFVFSKIWRALFYCYLRFEIRAFAMSSTNLSIKITGLLNKGITSPTR